MIHTQCVMEEMFMGEMKSSEQCRRIKELRESTGMNRKEFCDFFQIPYRTVTEWERDNRHAPEYVLRLLEYYIRTEQLIKKSDKNLQE